jgi:hypothetical protein
MLAYRLYAATQLAFAHLFFAVPANFQYTVLRMQTAISRAFPRLARLHNLTLRLHASV